MKKSLFQSAGEKALSAMAKDIDLYEKFLKYHGRMFQFPLSAALSCFIQQPEALGEIKRIDEQRIIDNPVQLGSLSLCFYVTDRQHAKEQLVQPYDFSQRIDEKLSDQWKMSKEGEAAVRSVLEFPEKGDLPGLLVNDVYSSEEVQDALRELVEELDIPEEYDNAVKSTFIFSVRTMIVGRLEIGGNKYKNSVSNSIYKRAGLDPEQQFEFMWLIAETAKKSLEKVERIVTRLERRNRTNVI